MNPYYYARDDHNGRRAWFVRGPDHFEMTIPDLDKNIACIIAKLLSGEWRTAKEHLDSIVDLKEKIDAM
jgi:hypothetical protein